MLTVTLALGAAVAGCGSSSPNSSSSASGSSSASTSSSAAGAGVTAPSTPSTAVQMGFEGVPIEPGPPLAPNTTGTGVVHGIACGPTEQLVYHIHAHLMVYVNGQPRSLTAGIGIPGSTVQSSAGGPVAVGGQCIYWLHTHAPDGVIHIESPTQRIYTLGEFFDEWQQPLSGNDVAGASGKVTAIVDGKPWTGSPRSIPLVPHTVIELAVGTPVPAFQTLDWSQTQL
jgi:hypothetical protein